MHASLTRTRAALAQRWSKLEPLALASRALLELPDANADWDAPPGIEPVREPIRLSVGLPDPDSLPVRELRASLERALAAPGDAALRYHFGPGYEPLREQLAQRCARDSGLAVDHDWFRLTNGSAGAIDLVCRALIEPGDVILTEEPCYMGTLQNFRAVQAEIVPLPMDSAGLRADALGRALDALAAQGRRAKLIYTSPSYQNPTGVAMPLARRCEILEVASGHDVLVLEDDAYRELWFGEPPPPSLFELAEGHGVLAVGTFSKILATGLRVGWLLARPEWIELVGHMRFDMGQSVLVHRMLADFLERGELDLHVARMRRLYAAKAATLCEALAAHASPWLRSERPAGGFYLWLELRDGLTAEELRRRATREGVAFPGGASFFPGRRDPGGEHVRLAFPWVAPSDLVESARRLGLACAQRERTAAARVPS